MAGTRDVGRLLRALISPSGWAFAILIVLSLVSIASRAWLLLKPMLFSRPGG